MSVQSSQRPRREALSEFSLISLKFSIKLMISTRAPNRLFTKNISWDQPRREALGQFSSNLYNYSTINPIARPVAPQGSSPPIIFRMVQQKCLYKYITVVLQPRREARDRFCFIFINSYSENSPAGTLSVTSEMFQFKS